MVLINYDSKLLKAKAEVTTENMAEGCSTNANQDEGTMEIVQYLDDQRREILRTTNIKDENFCIAMKTLAAMFKKASDRFYKKDDPEVQNFLEELSRLNERLPKQIVHDIRAWMIKREEMIETLKSSADKLDSSVFWATVCRLFGSSIDLLHNIDSLYDKQISSFLIEIAEGVSPKLGFITKTFSLALPYLTHVGLVGSFGDVFSSTLESRKILKVVKEDIECFEKIQDKLEEIGKLDEEMRKLLPFIIDSDLPAAIQKAFPECDSSEKIFILLCIAGYEMDLFSFDIDFEKNKFLKIIHLFSQSHVAAAWFDRCSKIDHRLMADIKELKLRNQLLHLAERAPDPDATMAVGGEVMKMKKVPHLIQALRNCIFSYYSAKELIVGVKHNKSDTIRTLKDNAQLGLHIMVEFKAKLED